MVSDLFRDVPTYEDVELPEDDDKETPDPKDEDADDQSDSKATDDNEEDDDDGDDDAPLSRAEARALKQTVRELSSAVGRVQSLTRQQARGNDDEDVRNELRKQNADMLRLLATVVGGIDENAIDPALRQRVGQAMSELEAAEQRKADLDALRKELGLTPQSTAARQQMADMQETANELAADIEDEIVAAGMDPDDSTLFPWQEWTAKFKEEALKTGDIAGAARTVRRLALTAVRKASEADASSTRREARRKASGQTPKGAAARGAKSDLDALTTGSLEDQMKALARLTRS